MLLAALAVQGHYANLNPVLSWCDQSIVGAYVAKKQKSPKHNYEELHRPAPVNDNQEPFQPPQISAAESRFRRIWPLAVIMLGLALTLAWLSIMGYGLIKLIECAI